MPEEKILFSSEFEGEGMKKGVDETIESLVKLKEEQAKLKTEIKDTKTELDKTTKSIEAYEKALKKATDPAQIKKLNEGLVQLKSNQVTLGTNLKQASTDLVVVSKGMAIYNKEINESIKNNRSAGEALNKFTNINALAGKAVSQFSGQITNAALGLVSGFAGGIIAAAIPAVIGLVESLFDAEEEMKELQLIQQATTEINETAIKSYAAQTVRLELYRSKLVDLSIPEKERIKIAKEYNKTAEDTNKIDIEQINNIDAINNAINNQIAKIKERAIARAAESVIAQRAERLFLAQEQARTRVLEQQKQDIKSGAIIAPTDLTGGVNNVIAQIELAGEAAKNIANDPKVKKAQEEFDAALKAGVGLITTDGLFSDTKIEKDKKQIENVYAKMLADLNVKLASITEKNFPTEGIIQNKFRLQLEKEFLAIEKLLKDKKLTGPEADILKGLLQQINDLELSKSLEEFRKKRLDALNSVNDAIINLQTQNAQRRIENIRDGFEQEKQAIEQNFQGIISTLTKQSADLIKKVNEDSEKGLIDPAVAKRKKLIITLLYGGLIDQAEQAKVNKELDLAFKVFQQTVNESNVQFEELLVQQDEKTAQQIRDEKTKLATGAINYETFQKNVTKILKDQKEARDKIRKAELEVELDAINKQLDATTDKSQRDKLEERQRAVRGQIAAIDTQTPKDDKDDPAKKRLDNFLKYAKAVNDVLTQVVSFWNQVNQAEERALDRSIALQEKRVENARGIAEKGNAEYLEMEQKRLDELERKREENARKQIAINNALVLSQATLAAITAIANASSVPGGAILAVGSVIAALAAAYSFVNSLQPQQASFFEGTEYVEQGRNPAGKDTVPAKLNIGERVVTTKDNEDYWTALNAIHNHLIPASVLNGFVQSYPNGGVPMVNFDKLSLATNGKIGADSPELLNRVDKLNNTMEEVVHGLSAIGINVNLDEQGFSASVSTYLRKQKIRGRS